MAHAQHTDMKHFFEQGRNESKRLIAHIAQTHIFDYLVPPSKMTFQGGDQLLLSDGTDKQVLGDLRIHSHALSQLCQKVEIRPEYIRKLLSRNKPWATKLAATNLTEHYANIEVPAGTRYLHRVVNGELRGFLSRRYHRHLASGPLLSAFMRACQLSGAHPVASRYNAVKNSLMCAKPELYEIDKSSSVAIGLEWSNSDFGAGRHSISLAVWTGRGTKWLLHDAMSQVHIGSVIEDSDLEASDNTHFHDMAAQESAISDTVNQQLTSDGIERVLDAIRKAHGAQVGWAQLRAELGHFLGKTQLEEAKAFFDESVEFLPPVQNGQAPMAWALELLGHLASKQDSADRKTELEVGAGVILGKFLDRAPATAS